MPCMSPLMKRSSFPFRAPNGPHYIPGEEFQRTFFGRVPSASTPPPRSPGFVQRTSAFSAWPATVAANRPIAPLLASLLQAKSLQRNLLLAVDFEQGVQPGDLKKFLHLPADLGKLHLASLLPDDAVTADQFSHAIAIHEIHAREIEQELLIAVAGEDVYQVAQSRAAVTQRESANRVHYNDAVDLSCANLKTHNESATFGWRRNHIPTGYCFQRAQGPAAGRGRIQGSLGSTNARAGLNGSRRSPQQALGAKVFIDVGPVYPVSAAGDLPVAALLGGGMEQPRIPCERDRDRASIFQATAYRVLIEAHVRHSFICRYCQNTHSRPPRAVADSTTRSIVTC